MVRGTAERMRATTLWTRSTWLRSGSTWKRPCRPRKTCSTSRRCQNAFIEVAADYTQSKGLTKDALKVVRSLWAASRLARLALE